MQADTKHVQELDTLPPFDPSAHVSSVRGLTSAANPFNAQVWNDAKPMVSPMVWAWYDEHKTQKVAKLGGFYQVTIGSFGIAEMVLTAIFGSREN